MLVNRDMANFLSENVDILSKYWRMDCGRCEQGKERHTCSECRKSYLGSRQTLEDIRRM